jgi:small-conductance mechanosensitive channel
MRHKISFGLLLIFGLVFGVAARPALAQAVAVHQAVAPAAAPAASGPAIIPGSPLAVLTGAGATPAPADADANPASPFGTGSLGLSLTSVIGQETAHTVTTFTAAVKQSTALTPVLNWINGFSASPSRRGYLAAIAAGLAMTVVPALVVEAVIGFLLRRPRAALAARAAALVPGQPKLAAGAAGIADAEAGETEKLPRRRLSAAAWFRRFARALLYFLLSLLPLAGFMLTAGVLLGSGLITTRQAKLAIIGLSNAYLVCRLALEVLRFFLAPKLPALRLLHVSDAHAGWVIWWVRVLLFSTAASYAVISIAEILGLPHAGSEVLIRLAALGVHIEVALMIWHGRKVVGSWIAGDPNATGAFALFRRGFGGIWHYFALFYILALWVALAGGVQNAFGVLLRVIVVFFVAMVIGRTAWTGSAQLLERLFPEAAVQTRRHQLFYTRARTYNPLLRAVIRVVIILAVVALILQGWGFHFLPWLLSDPLSRSLLKAFVSIIITVAVALTLWEIANFWLSSRIDRLSADGRTRQAARLRTLLPMLRATIGVSIGLVAGLICLSKIGVNAAPLLAGAGVLGIAIGFGSQKLVQDIITGLFLLLEDAMQVGDVVSLASMSGTVERLSIRTIRLRGGDGSVNIIPFSAVTTVTNMTRDFGYAQISIQVGYDEDLARVQAVLTDIGRTMRAEPAWGAMMKDDLQLNGLDEFGSNALIITGQIRTGPGQHWAVRREFYARIKRRFGEEGIVIPYIHQTMRIDPSGLREIIEPFERQEVSPPHPPEPGGPAKDGGAA